MVKSKTYRNLVKSDELTSFQVMVKETDLIVSARKNLKAQAIDSILNHRGVIESYIDTYPDFITTLTPWTVSTPMPAIVRDMVNAGCSAGVGPMAAVAGAIAEAVGCDLLKLSSEIVIENGGDVFIKIDRPTTVAIFANRSPMSLRLGLRINSMQDPVAVCTSTGTFGHSVSFGRADAACVVSRSCALADAAATAICNRVQTKADIQAAIAFGQKIEGVQGIVLILNEDVGLWGDLELIPLKGKKG